MTLDPSIWVLLAFVALIALIGRRSWETLCQHLDQRALTIHQNIQEAQKFKEEAQFALDHTLRLQQQMNQRSEEILTHSEIKVSQLKVQMEEELNTYLSQEEKDLASRLNILEKKILKDLETQAIESAFKAAEQKIIADTDIKIDDVLFQKGIEKIFSLPKQSL